MIPTLSPACAVAAQRSLTASTLICQNVATRVARDFGLDPAAMIAPTRGAPQVAFARQVAMYLAHIGFALSFETIGRIFHRDRTTVAHACRRVEDSRDDIWLDCRLATLELICRDSRGGVTNDGVRDDRV